MNPADEPGERMIEAEFDLRYNRRKRFALAFILYFFAVVGAGFLMSMHAFTLTPRQAVPAITVLFVWLALDIALSRCPECGRYIGYLRIVLTPSYGTAAEIRREQSGACQSERAAAR